MSKYKLGKIPAGADIEWNLESGHLVYAGAEKDYPVGVIIMDFAITEQMADAMELAANFIRTGLQNGTLE